MFGHTIRVYAVFSRPLRPGNETGLTDIVLNETCNDICSSNGFPGWRGGKYRRECVFPSVASCERTEVCVCGFSGSRNRPTTARSASDCFAFFSSSSAERSAQKSPHNVQPSKGRKACFGALFEPETVESLCNLKQPS